MADIDYPATLKLMRGWLDDNLVLLVTQTKKHEAIDFALEEDAIPIIVGNPDRIPLTAEQLAFLEDADMAMHEWIEDTCSAWDIEPVEIEE